MYPIAIKSLVRSYPLFVFAVALLGLNAAGNSIRPGFVASAILICLGLFTHRIVLKGDHFGWKGPSDFSPGALKEYWACIWRYLVLGLISFGVAKVALSVFFVQMLVVAFFSPLPMLITGKIYLVLLGLPVTLVLLIFGTLLPAAAIGGDATLKRAWRRGAHTFPKTLVRFVLGPGLISSLPFVLASLNTNWAVVPGASTLFFGTSLFLSAFAAHLSAVALSMAYHEGEAALA